MEKYLQPTCNTIHSKTLSQSMGIVFAQTGSNGVGVDLSGNFNVQLSNIDGSIPNPGTPINGGDVKIIQNGNNLEIKFGPGFSQSASAIINSVAASPEGSNAFSVNIQGDMLTFNDQELPTDINVSEESIGKCTLEGVSSGKHPTVSGSCTLINGKIDTCNFVYSGKITSPSYPDFCEAATGDNQASGNAEGKLTPL